MPASKHQTRKDTLATHKLAIDTARYQALRLANATALTEFKHPGDGQAHPHFRRLYVAHFARIYAEVMHDA